ncbi:MAG: hypothetical protein K2L99_04040 [Muribaculaceae bacterium]|nr:hypothetical protein [Muribaculaceae bacterium]
MEKYTSLIKERFERLNAMLANEWQAYRRAWHLDNITRARMRRDLTPEAETALLRRFALF